MTDTHIPIVLWPIGILLFLFWCEYGLKYIYNYKLREDGIIVMIFGVIPIWRIKFNSIVSAREVTFMEVMPYRSMEMFSTLRFGNNLFGKMLFIQRKKGLIRSIIITPDNIEEYIVRISSKIGNYDIK